MPKVIIFGASRQGSVVLEVLRAQGKHDILGFLDDDAAKHGTTIHGLPVLGGLDWAASRAGQTLGAIVAIGSNPARVAVAGKLRALGMALINAVHPTALIQGNTSMGTGNLLCAGAILVTGTRLEDDVVVNTAATIDHDSVLQAGAQVASGVHTSGCVKIGQGAFVGVGAILGPGVTVGEGAIVGAGSVVLGDIPPHVLAYGTPARVVKALDGLPDWRKILGGRS